MGVETYIEVVTVEAGKILGKASVYSQPIAKVFLSSADASVTTGIFSNSDTEVERNGICQGCAFG